MLLLDEMQQVMAFYNARLCFERDGAGSEREREREIEISRDREIERGLYFYFSH